MQLKEVASMKALEVTDASFTEDVLDSSLPVLLDCWAPRWEPSRGRARVMDAVALDLAGIIRVARVNVDENPATAGRLGIGTVPILLLFRNGRVIAEAVGAVTAAHIEAAVLCRLNRR